MSVNRVTVGEQVEATLRERILRKELLPGQVVTEEASAQMLGVSRPTVRQALATLEAEGLVTRNVGNRVLQVTNLSPEDVAAIYRARRVMELAGVEATRTIAAERLEVLWHVFAQIETAVLEDDPRGQVEADLSMHQTIVSFLDSPHLSTLENQLLTKMRLVIVNDRQDDPRAKAMLKDNRHLCELLTARQVDEARELLADRLDAAERSVNASMQTLHPRDVG